MGILKPQSEACRCRCGCRSQTSRFVLRLSSECMRYSAHHRGSASVMLCVSCPPLLYAHRALVKGRQAGRQAADGLADKQPLQAKPDRAYDVICFSLLPHLFRPVVKAALLSLPLSLCVSLFPARPPLIRFPFVLLFQSSSSLSLPIISFSFPSWSPSAPCFPPCSRSRRRVPSYCSTFIYTIVSQQFLSIINLSRSFLRFSLACSVSS